MTLSRSLTAPPNAVPPARIAAGGVGRGQVHQDARGEPGDQGREQDDRRPLREQEVALPAGNLFRFRPGRGFHGRRRIRPRRVSPQHPWSGS
jgi:hypothetical protein